MNRLVFAVLAASSSLVAQQIISTFAGTDWVFPDNGKQVKDAALSREAVLTTDPQGRIVFADRYNAIVGRVESDGRVTIIAGNGVRGFSGDGGDAASASLDEPVAAVYDRSGNLYIVDNGNKRIRRVTPQGLITTIAGNGADDSTGDNGPATRASMNPWRMAVLADGSLLVTDRDNYRIRRIGTNGVITTFAGNGQPDFKTEGLRATETSMAPMAIAVHPNGSVIVSDAFGYRLYRIGTDNIVTVIAGNGKNDFTGDGGPAKSATISNIEGLIVDSAGSILLADTSNYRIRRIGVDGTISTIAGNGETQISGSGGDPLKAGIGAPLSLTQDREGRIYFSELFNASVWRFAPGYASIELFGGNGRFKFITEGSPAILAPLSEPWGVAAAPDGSLFIADSGSNKVLRVGPDGNVATFAGLGVYGFGGDGGQARNARLRRPSTIALDGQGRLVIVDQDNDCVRRVETNGVITTIAGTRVNGFAGDNGPATQARFNRPYGVAIDAAGNIYISDIGNNRVRRIAPNGIITTVAGNGTAGYAGDNGPGTSASLNFPGALAFNAAGELLIADARNHRIRALSAAGIIRTFAGNGQAASAGDGRQATEASFRFPFGIANDSAGNVYVTQSGLGTIRLINASGLVSTFAGRDGVGFSGDGGVPTGALFNSPGGLTIDREGNVYIGDEFNHRVRRVRTLAPTTTLSPSTITLSAIRGSATNTTQRINIASQIPGLRFTTAVAYQQGQGWLNVTASSEIAPAALTVYANAANLAAGRYTATLSVRTEPPGNSNPVTITLEVTDPPSQLSLSSRLITFSKTLGNDADTFALELRNEGGGTINYQIRGSVTGTSNWLSVTPASGAIGAGQTASVTVTANPSTLREGTYQGSLVITGAVQPITVPVSLALRGNRGSLLVSQPGLTFVAVAGGGPPLPQQVGLLNVGSGVMNWSATSRAGWMRVTPNAGTIRQPFTEVALLDISVAHGDLRPGEYFDQITVTGDADNSPQLITVRLNVLPEGSNPGPDVTPTGMIFISREGENPGSQSIKVNHLSKGNATYESARLGGWYNTSPGNGRAIPGQPAAIVVQPDLSRMASGVRRGVVTLQVQEDGSIRTVNLLSVVAPAQVGDSKDGRGAFSCASDELQVLFTLLREGFVARVGEATTVEVRVADRCGNPLVATTGSPSAQVKGTPQSGDGDFSLVHVGQGVWRGTWRPVRALPSTRLAVKAILGGAGGGGGVRVQSGTAELSGSVVAQSGTNAPVLTAGGVVHAASLNGGVPVAPGSLITLFGEQLAEGRTLADGAPLPVNLNGTEVRMGDRALPILFASDKQLNVQVPYDLGVNTQHHGEAE
jgi:sugar lactone lactonase YvrE